MKHQLGMKLMNVLAVAAAILTFDLIWLHLRAPMYRKMVYKVQGSPLKLRARWGAVAYVLMIASILIFSGPLADGHIGKATAYGGALGFVVYGIYNATNLATLTNFDPRVAVIDTIWGTALFAIATVVYVLVQRKK